MQKRTEQVAVPGGERFDLHVVTAGPPGPGVLLLQEIYGVGEFLHAKAAALAGLGYTVGIPDVFWRVERNVSLAHDEEALETAYGYMAKFSEIPADVTSGDLVAALEQLRSVPEVTGRVGVLGYCLGGRLAFEVAAAGEPDACVSYYGAGIAQELELAERITCPVLFHFGGADQFISRDDVAAVQRAFAGRDNVQVVVQAQAGHAFENSFAPMWSNPEAAAASWPVTVDFLEHTLRC